MKYEIDENTIWVDTGRIKINNYPPSSNCTYSYITRIYREIKKNQVGWKEVDGEPIYFNKITSELIAFAKIMAECETALDTMLPREMFLKVIEDYPF
jgi:hypothetical protein